MVLTGRRMSCVSLVCHQNSWLDDDANGYMYFIFWCCLQLYTNLFCKFKTDKPDALKY